MNLLDLIKNIATNHGVPELAMAKTAPAKAIKRKTRDGEGDNTVDTNAAQDAIQADAAPASGGDAPLQLALNETGVTASGAPMQLAAAETGAAVAGGAGAGAGAGAAAAGGIGMGTLVAGGLVVGGIAVAAGSGGGGGPAPAGDTTAPTVSSVAITSATGIQNSTLNAGDVVSVTVTMSEATTVTGTPQLALDIGGTTVQASYASGSGTAALVFSYTILSGQTDAGGIGIAANSLALNTGTLKDSAGNNATLTHALVADNGSYKVDTTAPAFTSAASANFAENGTGTAYDATADGDTGVAYALGGTDAALFNIHATSGAVTFITSPNYEAPADSNGNNVYDITVTATDAAGNATNQAVALTVTDVVEAGQAVIDLGAYGKLIAPVNVDGNWYYHWDRSGDGTNANSGGLNGGLDYTTHDVLDGLFNRDINGVTNTTVQNADGLYGTTDTYRYATLNGVQLALPTTNGSAAYPNGINAYQPGTAIDNSPAGEVNPTYDDLLAIWDGYNGTGTGTNINGTPSGWQAGIYWSAAPSASGHAVVYMSSGFVDDGNDIVNGIYVALQVL